ARGRAGGAVRRPRRRRRGEVRRRRAPGLPAAAYRGEADAAGRPAGGAGPSRARGAHAAARRHGRGGARAVGEPRLGDRTRARVERARMGTRRRLGLDRSGPPPPETLAGHPLNPWTIPNAIGFARLALIPVFLVIAYNTDDGQTALGAAIFLVVAVSDYLDGIAARVTGQYSRLGALLDPLVDRVLVVSGLAVCWSYELLPRWATGNPVGRELLMVALARVAIQRGV